jgi:hypothetical protein
MKVLPEIIEPDQTCGIPGRSITSNLTLFRDLITYTQNKNIRGYIVSLDQEKAFDRVNHAFLLRILETCNFGEHFINWIKTIYKNNSSFILQHGHLSLPIRIMRGVRQGCPLSALLYLLIGEVLAEAVRQNNDVKGFKLPGSDTEIKASLYADDTEFLLVDEYSIVVARWIISRFEKGSGSKLNQSKSKIFPLHLNDPQTNQYIKENTKLTLLDYGIPITLLGLTFYLDYRQTCNSNFFDIMSKIQSKAQILSQRSLSLRGRAIVANSMLTSKLWYAATILSIPKYILKKVNTFIFSYIWKNKKLDAIARDFLYQPEHKGGLGLLNVQSQALALRIKQINPVLCADRDPSIQLTKYWIRQKLSTALPIAHRPNLGDHRYPSCDHRNRG